MPVQADWPGANQGSQLATLAPGPVNAPMPTSATAVTMRPVRTACALPTPSTPLE